jgi:wyosine [tRNA(Phe)-imidazoG37] synthetase (radical SAM superfamily)
VALTLDFKDHRRELDENAYIYAVVSRRARGLSVGVNLNPDKICNFDCPYCQVDRTVPGGPARIDLDRLEDELETLLHRAASSSLWSEGPFDTAAPSLRRIADIAFSGDGEPTTPPEFPEAARRARAIRDRHGLDVPMRLITNATLFDRPRVHDALRSFDELWCKLDAGTEEYFRFVDGTRLPFAQILRNLTNVAKERSIVIQSMFLAHHGVGPTDAEIAAYTGRLGDIVSAGGTIDHVQVYTVARRPADPEIEALPRERLDAIAAAIQAQGLKAEVYD